MFGSCLISIPTGHLSLVLSALIVLTSTNSISPRAFLSVVNKAARYLILVGGQGVGHTASGTRPAIARKMAIEIRDTVKIGKDPFAVMASRRKAKSLGTIYDEFIKNRIKPGHLKKKSKLDMLSRKKLWIDLKSNRLKNRQIRMQYKGALSIGRIKMVELEKDDYVRFHHAVSQAGKYQANRCIEDLRVLEKYAIEKGYVKQRICIFRKKELNREIKRMDVEDPYTNSLLQNRIQKFKKEKKKANQKWEY